MRNVCDTVVEVLRSRSAEAPLNLEEILSHVIVLGGLERNRTHATDTVAEALKSEMRRRADSCLPQRFATDDGVWWQLVDPPPARLRPAGRGWMAQLVRDVRWRGTAVVGTHLESFRYDASSATALLRAGRGLADREVTLSGQIEGNLNVPTMRGGLLITADVDGDIVVDGPIGGDFTIGGQVAGAIKINASIEGTLSISSSVHRGVRIATGHVGRVQIDGQIGGPVEIATRVIDGMSVQGWVAGDLSVAGTIAGEVRTAADVSGSFEISKRVMGNVKAGGWILGGVDVTGPVDGEVAVQSWVGGPVSITGPVASVDLGNGRFYGPVKIRPDNRGRARTVLKSIRLAEFHAPVRIDYRVDTAAVDATAVVGRSQLRCVGARRRPPDLDAARPKLPPAPQALPRIPEPMPRLSEPMPRLPVLGVLKPNEPFLLAPSVAVPVTHPSGMLDETLPNPPRPAKPQVVESAADPPAFAERSGPGEKLQVADTELTLAELAQQEPDESAVETAHSPAEPAEPQPITSHPVASHPIEPERGPAPAVAPLARRKPSEPKPDAGITLALLAQPKQPETASGTQLTLADIPVTVADVAEQPAVDPTTAAPRRAQVLPAVRFKEDHDPSATRQLVLGIAWLS